jgi:hypothetical protein
MMIGNIYKPYPLLIMIYRCIVDVPVTILFRSGTPFKVLSSEPANRGLHSVLLSSIAEADVSTNDDSIAAMRTCRRLLLDYSNEHGYSTSGDNSSGASFFCTVREYFSKLNTMKLNAIYLLVPKLIKLGAFIQNDAGYILRRRQRAPDSAAI